MATPGGPKRLSQLSLGEQVLAVDPSTGRLQFSPVYMWSSRRPGQTAQYVTVRTDAGLNITGAPGGPARCFAQLLPRPRCLLPMHVPEG